jgi:uncharacterized protein YuzE
MMEVVWSVNRVPIRLKVPATRYWVDYDDEADVLYICFRKPQRATDSKVLANGVILRRAGARIVGVTVLNASARR